MSSPSDEARQLRVLLAQVVAGLDVESETGELVDSAQHLLPPLSRACAPA